MGSGRGGVRSRTGRVFKLKLLLQLEGTQVGKNSHMSLNQTKPLFNLAGDSISIILELQGHRKAKMVPIMNLMTATEILIVHALLILEYEWLCCLVSSKLWSPISQDPAFQIHQAAILQEVLLLFTVLLEIEACTFTITRTPYSITF